MKYLYFDTSFGFSPLMALGALADLEKEDFLIREILSPFRAQLFCEQVQRGVFEGCLAHIDIDISAQVSAGDVIESTDLPTHIRELMLKYAALRQNSASLREILEAVSSCVLAESFGVDGIYFGTGRSGDFIFGTELSGASDFENDAENTFEISPSGEALLKLVGATCKKMPDGEITHTGYGADVSTINEKGVLRAVIIETEKEKAFEAFGAYESLFMQETAIL